MQIKELRKKKYELNQELDTKEQEVSAKKLEVEDKDREVSRSFHH